MKWHEKLYYRIIWKGYDTIRNLFYNFINRCERFSKGYSQYDVTEVDLFFVETILPMLKEFRKKTIWYPSLVDSGNEWLKILDEIIEGFEIAKEVVFSYYIFDCDFDKLNDERKEFYIKHKMKILSKKKYDRAFELFHKYFGCFGD